MENLVGEIKGREDEKMLSAHKTRRGAIFNFHMRVLNIRTRIPRGNVIDTHREIR